jgi:predicted site-specific integrase-resolvase
MSSSTKKDELEKQIKELKYKLDEQESLLVDRTKVISSLKSDIARNEDELADIDKPVLTREQAMQVHDAIRSAVERFEFNDPDNFEYELSMDYENRVNLESLSWQGDSDQLANDVWEEVSECFGEFIEKDTNE